MDDQKRRDDGMAKRRKVLGGAWVDKSVAGKNAFNADFLDLITRHAWGEIWTRPHFDERTRRVLVIGTMVALGQWDEFRLHVRAALAEGGFTPDDIKETLLQQAIYCGLPAAASPTRDAMIMLMKLISPPMPSANAKASSHPPLRRILSRVVKIRNTAKNATTVSFPTASSQAKRTVLMVANCMWSLKNSAIEMFGRS